MHKQKNTKWIHRIVELSSCLFFVLRHFNARTMLIGWYRHYESVLDFTKVEKGRLKLPQSIMATKKYLTSMFKHCRRYQYSAICFIHERIKRDEIPHRKATSGKAHVTSNCGHSRFRNDNCFKVWNYWNRSQNVIYLLSFSHYLIIKHDRPENSTTIKSSQMLIQHSSIIRFI